MKSALKNFIRDLVPPVVLRALVPPTQSRLHNIWDGEDLVYDPKGTLIFPNGIEFKFRPTVADRGVCHQVLINQDYNFERLTRFKEIQDFYNAVELPVIIDAGANIGAASVWFAYSYPKASVIAIEPARENIALLTSNTRSFPLVIPIQAAIASESGELTLTDPGNGEWAFRTSADKDVSGYSVPAITIEQAMSNALKGTPFILKIDIEGAEEDLFSRHSEMFDQFPVVIIELHDWMLPNQATSNNFLGWHASHKRDFVYIGENIFSISNSVSALKAQNHN